MNLKEILSKIDLFSTTANTEDYHLSEFFDEIGERILLLGELNKKEKETCIETLFNFLKRQSPLLEENFSFIHLIECFDEPDSNFYENQLLKFNSVTPTLTSILLLNGLLNTTEGEVWQKGVILFKNISENEQLDGLIRKEAKDYYDYQIEK